METKKQVLNAFRLELNKWLNHSVRGMKSGNPAYFQGKITLIHDLLGFIHDIDNQEEPDKSLDEAANEFAWKNFSNNHAKAAAIQAFKAGAEWAFGQVGFTKEMVVGYKTAGHGSVEPGIEILFFNGEFKDGDKVIVQIRKK